MVRKLVDICVDGVRDGIENGTITRLCRLPTNLRQPILDSILENRSSIYKAKCIDILSSIEFLDGLSQIDTQLGGPTTDLYFDRLAVAMTEMKSDGKKLGESVSKLSVNVRTKIRDRRFCFQREPVLVWWDGRIVTEILSRGAIDLIGECSNLSSLALNLLPSVNEYKEDEDMTTTEEGPEDEGALFSDACMIVIKNVGELSLRGQVDGPHQRPVFGIPIYGFGMTELTKLKSLNLCNVWVEVDSWRNFLDAVKGTLENLNVENFKIESNHNRAMTVLPISMPNLVKLRAIDCESLLPHSQRFVGNLINCPKLKYVSLDMKAVDADEEYVFDEGDGIAGINHLAEIDALQDLKLHGGINDDDFVSLFETFGQKISALKLREGSWNGAYNNRVLKRAIDRCPNLQSIQLHRATFLIFSFEIDVTGGGEEFSRNMGAANRIVAELLVDKVRASKLRQVELTGKIDEDILTAIRENCTNLKRLRFAECDQVDENYLIRWAERDGEKCVLIFKDCQNINYDLIEKVNKISGSVMFEKE